MTQQSLVRVSLFSYRQDVAYLCKKAVEAKFNFSQFSDFSPLSLTPLSISIFDSDFLSKNPKLFDSVNADFMNKSICLLDSDITDSILTSIEEHFSFVLTFPPDPQLLLSYINILVTQNKSLTKNSKAIENKTDFIPEDIDGFFSGSSALMKKLRREILLAASCETPVLLIGETGTGKTTAANLIHKYSSRKSKKIQSINMATISEGIADSTLFGSKEGGFTDAKYREGLIKLSDNGTFFMDEIETASEMIQAKLLTIIETGTMNKVGSDETEKVNFRLISATNADILSMLNNGSFRKDFFFRISGLIIKFPPLRDYKEDIPVICNNYIKNKGLKISEEAFQKLQNYYWPGNIRELLQCIDRAIIKCTGKVITPELIDFGLFDDI